MRIVLRHLLLLLIIASAAYAQSDTIIPNPKAVKLRRIWMVRGLQAGAYLGDGLGDVGDVNGDSLGDFAVLTGKPWQWQVFYGKQGGPTTIPAWTFDSGAVTPPRPIVGDFWGTGHRAVGFMRMRLEGERSTPHYWLHIFSTDSNRIDSVPKVIWDSQGIRVPQTIFYADEAIGADLDADGDDELILTSGGVRRDSVRGSYAETWIFEGGPGFQVDTPTVILRDPVWNESSNGDTYVTDFNKDGYVDLLRGEYYGAHKLRFSVYLGNGGLPSADKLPDRVFELPRVFPFMADVDGDGILDFVLNGLYVWRSGAGKDPMTRSFDSNDVDAVLIRSDVYRGVGKSFRLGYLNSKRYEMIGRLQSGFGEPMLATFSGGPNGPNRTWDGYYYASGDSLPFSPIWFSSPLGDVDGDGWNDAMVSNWAYPDNISARGIAIVIAGGSYIPTDDPSVGVRQFTVAGVENAVSVWPNPATTELNIAWRGDLSRTPHRFEIYDMLGHRVATGIVDDASSALWPCADVPAGSYRINIFDVNGVQLATTSCVKN